MGFVILIYSRNRPEPSPSRKLTVCQAHQKLISTTGDQRAQKIIAPWRRKKRQKRHALGSLGGAHGRQWRRSNGPVFVLFFFPGGLWKVQLFFVCFITRKGGKEGEDLGGPWGHGEAKGMGVTRVRFLRSKSLRSPQAINHIPIVLIKLLGSPSKSKKKSFFCFFFFPEKKNKLRKKLKNIKLALER